MKIIYQHRLFKVGYRELLFTIALFFFATALILSNGVFAYQNEKLAFVFKLLRYLAYGLCCVKIICTEINRKLFLCTFPIFLAFVLSAIKSDERTMALYSLILWASIGIDNEKIINMTAKLQLFYLTLIVMLSQIGVLTDFVFVNGGRLRHGLGFGWTTNGPIIYFYFCLSMIYLHRRKISRWMLLLLEVGNIWFYHMTKTRFTFVLMTAFIVFILFETTNRKKWKLLSKLDRLYILYPFLMAAISVAAVLLYDPSNRVWISVNDLISNRLILGKNAFTEYGLTLFGNEIEWIGYSIGRSTRDLAVGYNYVDSSYLQLGLNYGLLSLIAVLTLYSIGIKKAIKARDYYLVMIYVCILTFALTEPQLMNFAFNPFPLLTFGTAYKDKRYDKPFRAEYSNAAMSLAPVK